MSSEAGHPGACKRRIDASFDNHGRAMPARSVATGKERRAGEPAIAVNEKFDPVIVAKNLSILWLRCVRKRTGGFQTRPYESQLFFAPSALFAAILLSLSQAALGFNLA